MKTWFKVPESVPDSCVSCYLMKGKWYEMFDLRYGGGSFVADNSEVYYIYPPDSSYLNGYAPEVQEFEDDVDPNQAFYQDLTESLKEDLDLTQDNVNSPAHYTSNGGIECIDYIKSILSKEEYIGYLRGNITKYLHRWRNKNGLEDLKKSQWYQAELIAVMEEATKE